MPIHHYTYYSYEEWGRGYIGVRTCECLPEEDVKYFGSFTDTNFNPNQKIIFRSDYETRKEANEDEITLHDFYDVAKNPHFANRAKQTSTKFDVTGMTCTEEHKRKVSVAKTGKPRSEETKQNLRENWAETHPLSGVPMPEETKQKIRDAKIGVIIGEKHPWYGQHHTEEAKRRIGEARRGIPRSDETKRKLREANLGKMRSKETIMRHAESMNGRKWWSNAAGKTKFQHESPGPEWQQSRKWETNQ